MTPLAENLALIEDQIAAACRQANRNRAEVELMAVSKTYPAETILEAAALGLTLFGENRVQEFASKAPELTGLRLPGTNNGCPIHPAASSPDGWESNSPPIRFHLIGHLQSNKSQRAAELFDGIDSVDSLRLAQRLNEAAQKLNHIIPILLEVKLSPEETKEGLDPASRDADELLERLPNLAHLRLDGLMTIAPWGAPDDETRACFRSLRQWRERWAAAHPRLSLGVLSMGMSGDFPLAIAEGATRIRIGTALFGKRPPTAAQLAAWPES
jgi:PLP dependent protein